MKKMFQTTAFAGTPEMQKRLEKVLEDLRDTPGALLPILQNAQKIYGYLAPEVLTIIAFRLGMSVSEVASVASFYSFFNREKYGQNIIRICKSAPCHVNGAQETFTALKEALGICAGETTADGKFSLLTCECLGVCDRAPAVMINETVYGPVRPEDVAALLAKY